MTTRALFAFRKRDKERWNERNVKYCSDVSNGTPTMLSTKGKEKKNWKIAATGFFRCSHIRTCAACDGLYCRRWSCFFSHTTNARIRTYTITSNFKHQHNAPMTEQKTQKESRRRRRSLAKKITRKMYALGSMAYLRCERTVNSEHTWWQIPCVYTPYK